MRYGIRTIDELFVRGQTVLCRIDINQPVDRETGTLKSISRIRACVPTLRELSDGGAKLVLLAHQGSDIEYQNYYTTKPHSKVLSELLGREVKFIPDVCGPAAQEAISQLRPGEILLLDNVRFLAEEQTLFELKLQLTHAQQAQTLLVRTLVPLADLYVCDAFAAAHRDELDAYNAAVRYFKVHLEGTKYSTKKLNEERTQLAGEVAEYRERLSAVQEDVKILRDVRHWLNQVLPSEQYRQTAEPGKKPSIQQAVKGRAQRIREEQGEKRQQPRTEKKQDMEL